MRVALLATVVEFGGIERVLLTLLQHMQVDIEFFPVFFTRAEGRRSYFLERLDASGIFYEAIYVDSSRYKYFSPLRNILETNARFKARGFDLIHSHGYRADFIGLFVSRYFGLPIVSTCHGFISTDLHLSAYNRLDVFLLRFFNRVIAVSEQMKEDLVARGVPGEKVQVITNAVCEESRSDTERVRRETRTRLGVEHDEFVLGFAGRLSEEKGLGHLLEAVKAWTPTCVRWRLILIGEGPHRGVLEHAVRELGLAGKVLFAGFQGDLAQWYPAMDAFVLPSLTEGTPMVLLEAMATGIPVIATSVGGVPAMISSGENGILVPPGDASRLRDAIQSLASNCDLRERLCANAIHLVRKNHSVGRWAVQIRDVYTSTLEQSRRR